MEGMLLDFYESYKEAVTQNKVDIRSLDDELCNFLEFIADQYTSPYHFGLFHKKITEPFNYYQFGMDFLRPLIKMKESTILGIENLDEIVSLLSKGENVIFLANHQTEPDPHAIALLVEKSYPKLAQEMIFVAGHRVVTDPLTVPFSMGLNLLCIYSKNYIEHPPEQKYSKMLHNQKTMKKMSELLTEGGKCIYVAPSGGRDRPNKDGVVEVKPFDAQSIEMFWLMAKYGKKPTHFFPLALSTFDLLPPPNEIVVSLGEDRRAKCSPIHLNFGKEIKMDGFTGEKREKRQKRADSIWSEVCRLYSELP